MDEGIRHGKEHEEVIPEPSPTKFVPEIERHTRTEALESRD